MVSKTKATEEVLEKAKKLYLEYVPIKEIAAKLGIGRTTIQYHANTYWDTERELQKAELFRAFSDTKKVTMTKLSSASLQIMVKAIEETAKNKDRPPTLREAQQAAQILESIDKIMRLDDGKPTDITESKPVTTIELRKKLSLDPFAKIEEIEFKETSTKGEENETV